MLHTIQFVLIHRDRAFAGPCLVLLYRTRESRVHFDKIRVDYHRAHTTMRAIQTLEMVFA